MTRWFVVVFAVGVIPGRARGQNECANNLVCASVSQDCLDGPASNDWSCNCRSPEVGSAVRGQATCLLSPTPVDPNDDSLEEDAELWVPVALGLTLLFCCVASAMFLHYWRGRRTTPPEEPEPSTEAQAPYNRMAANPKSQARPRAASNPPSYPAAQQHRPAQQPAHPPTVAYPPQQPEYQMPPPPYEPLPMQRPVAYRKAHWDPQSGYNDQDYYDEGSEEATEEGYAPPHPVEPVAELTFAPPFMPPLQADPQGNQTPFRPVVQKHSDWGPGAQGSVVSPQRPIQGRGQSPRRQCDRCGRDDLMPWTTKCPTCSSVLPEPVGSARRGGGPPAEDDQDDGNIRKVLERRKAAAVAEEDFDTAHSLHCAIAALGNSNGGGSLTLPT
eukprot:Hpha_TRINITY_DN1881_c0_g1::TRINITY_DN1881_c0_g1_i1::g.170549::m.170549